MVKLTKPDEIFEATHFLIATIRCWIIKTNADKLCLTISFAELPNYHHYQTISITKDPPTTQHYTPASNKPSICIHILIIFAYA